MKFVVQMQKVKETKNTFKYEETVEAGKPLRIGTLYIQKWALSPKAPDQVNVTLESADADQ